MDLTASATRATIVPANIAGEAARAADPVADSDGSSDQYFMQRPASPIRSTARAADAADESQPQQIILSRARPSEEKFGFTLALLETPRGTEKMHETIVKLPRQPDQGQERIEHFGVEVDEGLRVSSVLRPTEPHYEVEYQMGAVRARGLPDARHKAQLVVGRWGIEISPQEQASEETGAAYFNAFSVSYLTFGSWQLYSSSICIQVPADFKNNRAITLFTKQGEQLCNSMMAATSQLKEFLETYGKESFVNVFEELAPNPSVAGVREGMRLMAVNR